MRLLNLSPTLETYRQPVASIQHCEVSREKCSIKNNKTRPEVSSYINVPSQIIHYTLWSMVYAALDAGGEDTYTLSVNIVKNGYQTMPVLADRLPW